MNSNDLISGLVNGRISLVKSLRINRRLFFKRLFFGPRPGWKHISSLVIWTLGLCVMKCIVGPICRFVLFCILLGGKGPEDEDYWRIKRKRTVSIVRFFFPDIMRGDAPAADKQGLIVGFNHPTLHEVFGLIAWSLAQYIDRRNNFPTNLPWYESICSCSPLMEKIGIYITPLITQSSYDKLVVIHEGDERMIGFISKIRDLLLNHYFNIAIEFEKKGDNTFSAPSATRQFTIFPKTANFEDDEGAMKLLPAMSGLMLRIARANRDRKPNVIFLPVTIIPPRFRIKWVRGLKPFRKFIMVIGRGFSMDEARALGRGMDYAFLKRLAENAPEELWYPKPAA